MGATFDDILYQNYYLKKNELVNRINNEIDSKLTNLNDSIDEIIKNKNTLEIYRDKKQIIKNICIKLNLKNIIDNFVSKVELKNKDNLFIHKNILLVGKTGVGKSTLVNSFLKIDKAETGIGKPITQNFNSYLSDPDSSFRLIDSKGIENSYKEAIDNIKSFISQKLLSNNKDEFIHCIWYCMTGTKYNDEDKGAIKILLSSYEDDCLPIIIVYTQTIAEDEADEYLDKIKEFLGEKNDKLRYIKILAKDKIIGRARTTEKAFGLEELKEMTLKRISQAEKSSYYQSIREGVIDLYKNNIKAKKEMVKIKALNMIKLTQYHSIDLLNFEQIFLELLNLIYFNDNNKYNFVYLLNQNNVDNNIIHYNVDIDENAHLIVNQINNLDNNLIYSSFLKRIKQSYIDEFKLNIYNKYIQILKNLFPKFAVSENRNKLFNRINKEFRSYIEIEKDNNLEKKNNLFIAGIAEKYYNNEYEGNLDINNINNSNIIEDNNDLEVGNISQINDLKNKTEEYKISYNNILKIKEIEHKVIVESLIYFTNEIIDSIQECLLEDEYINYLKNSVKNKIILKMKCNLNNSINISH